MNEREKEMEWEGKRERESDWMREKERIAPCIVIALPTNATAILVALLQS